MFAQKQDGSPGLNKSTARRGNVYARLPFLQEYSIYIDGQRHKICGLLYMYTCYVATVTSYEGKKDSRKKIVKGK